MYRSVHWVFLSLYEKCNPILIYGGLIKSEHTNNSESCSCKILSVARESKLITQPPPRTLYKNTPRGWGSREPLRKSTLLRSISQISCVLGMLLLVVLILRCICFLIHKVQEYNQKKSSSAASTPFDLRNSLTFQGTCARLLAQGSLPDLWSLNPTDGRQKDSLLLSLCISFLPCPSSLWLCHYSLACCPYFIWQNLVNLTPECSETLGNTLNSWRTRRVPEHCFCMSVLMSQAFLCQQALM